MKTFKPDETTFKHGTTLIEASAGTGKTYSICEMFVKAIREGKNVRNIAAITYTEAAAADLKKRLRKSLEEERKDEKIEKALNDFDLLAVSTIHSFCNRLLGAFPVETNTPAKPEFIDSGDEFKDETAMDFWRFEVLKKASKDTFENGLKYADIAQILRKEWKRGKKILPEIKDVKSLEKATDKIEIQRHAIEYGAEQFDKYKESLGQLTFDDLPGKLNKALSAESTRKILGEEASKMYELVFIDEFQDSDPLMAEIFKALFGGNEKTALFYIGDPKQSIFGFRNADIFSYLDVEKEIDPENKLTLNNNYRSTPEIIDAIHHVFTINDDPFNIGGRIAFNEVIPKKKIEENLVDNDKNKKALNIWGVAEKKNPTEIIYQNIVHEIKRLFKNAKIGNKSVKPSDIAILVSSNKESATLKEMLSKAGVPSIISSSVSVFKSDVAKDLKLFLNAVIDNRNLKLIKGALFTMFFGEDTAQCAQLDTDSNLVDKWLTKFEEWHELLNEKGFLKMFSSAFKSEDFENKIAAQIDAERNLTNLRHLLELLHGYEKKHDATPNQIIQFMIERYTDDDANCADEYEQRLDSEKDRVVISTMHKSKGLEYNIVFVPSLYKGPRNISGDVCAYHDCCNNPVVSFFKTNDEKEIVRLEELQEKLRLCYVALTRAVHRAYFAVVNNYKQEKDFIKKTVPGHLFNCGFSEIEIKINGFSNISYENIEAVKNDDTDQYTPDDSKYEIKKAFEFKRKLGIPFKISSYSALAKKKSVSDKVDVEAVTDDEAADVENDVEGNGIFAFKKGAFAGIVLHKLFETINFSKSIDDLRNDVEDVLKKHNLLKKSETEEWTDDIAEMVKNVLAAKLNPGFSLSGIEEGKRFNEMEFLFPVDEIKKEKIAEILKPEEISVDFNAFKGFINGFIDLVFEKDDKYYIVDWKSNHLGNSVKDYCYENLDKAMKKANYDLQYMIYTAALHLHLSKTVKNYDYDKHFGGVFYIFLRGVDEKGKNGIYYKKPDKDVVESLAGYLQEVKNEQ
jgi:exodeoxyribonuclease V beta subunit